MSHETSLIATLALSLIAVLIGALAATRLRLPLLLGYLLGGSDLGEAAAKHLHTLQNALVVLFFVAVGMLFDPTILLQAPLRVLAMVAVIVLGKAITALALALVFRRAWPTGLTIAASVAQIGEFSFILAGLGLSLRLLPPEGLNLIVAGALFSIALNLLLFRFARTLEQRTRVPAAEGGVASAQT